MDIKFCERVESLAKRHGYKSVKVLLRECDVSFTSFYRWKRGVVGCPSADQAVMLAEKLHTSVEYLMRGTRPSNSGDMTKINRLAGQMEKLVIEIKSLSERPQS
jgi:hypothetical protein